MEKCIEVAMEARDRAYVPYSGFSVGACLVTEDGTMISGCNIENASYGLSNCAERTALFKAISDGRRDFTGMVVLTDTKEVASPCGACRQVMVELCPPHMEVWLCNVEGMVKKTTVSLLLPGAFTQEDLYAKK